ncbi:MULTISPECIES: MFS transporter [Bradyrhizobium]|uniref:MFS transporter n=1 Tax=Bradyrhizobium TaxID=374 RepID=UPI002012FB84|nr:MULTISPECIES: MFS transporter [Bradyrhizobium]
MIARSNLLKQKAHQMLRYRAWYTTGSAALMLALVMGTLVNGLTAFFVAIEAAEGWGRSEIAAINSFGLLGIAAGSVVMGFVSDRLGIRPICLIAVTVMGACLLLTAYAHAPWQLYVIFFLAGALSGGALFAPIFATVGNWFPTSAGLAIGIAAAGQAVGQGGVPFLSAYLIERFGWRGAMIALGTAVLVTLLPLAAFMRDAPAPAFGSGAAYVPPIRSTVAVPILSVAVFLCCSCMAVPLMHLMPLIQGLCIPATDAGGVMLAMLLAAIAGRIAYGKLCDMIGPLSSWAVASALQTAGVLAFTQFVSFRGFLIFSIVYGFAYAGVMTSVLVSARALTPPARRGALMGIILAFAWIGHAFGGYQGAAIFDLTGSYTTAFAIGSAAGLLNLALVMTLLVLSHRGRLPATAEVLT